MSDTRKQQPIKRNSLTDLGSRLNILQDPWYQFKLFVLKTKILESGVGIVIGRAFQDCVRTIKAIFERNLSHLRECPYCISDIPVEASRCSFCTSHVDPFVGRTVAVAASMRSKVIIEDRTRDWIDTSELEKKY
ncbi:hypothetical protein HK100_007370 [Physocladia obscura]|uniref:Uncharacterized protein n=1 Tax=Physocladia obscura TaxID=109957 RepID=A0AAD5SQU3_9FUNG|nr:hypothetical protein HK100_007370 [Physocladia obscura]